MKDSITKPPQETTVLLVASADLDTRSILLMIDPQAQLLKLVHLFVETTLLMKVKNVMKKQTFAQLLVNAEKDGRSIQVLIDLILLKQMILAAPYVEMVILIKERNATQVILLLCFVQIHAIACRDIKEILILNGEKQSQQTTSHAPNFVETIITTN